MLVVDVWAGGAVPGLEGSSLGLSRVLGVTDREELTVWGAKDNGGCLTGGTFAENSKRMCIKILLGIK